MKFKLVETVEKFDNIYFTYSLIDLKELIMKHPNELIRICYFPDSEIFATGLTHDYIHWDIYKRAKYEGLTDLEYLKGPINLYALALKDITADDIIKAKGVDPEDYEDIPENPLEEFFFETDYYMVGKDGIVGLQKRTIIPKGVIPKNIHKFLKIFN